MKKISYLINVLGVILIFQFLMGCSDRVVQTEEFDIKSVENQLILLEKNVQSASSAYTQNAPRRVPIVPLNLSKERDLKLVTSDNWCSGFFPGMLWYMYELSGADQWKVKANHYTVLLEKEKEDRSTHDIGFKMMCSYGHGYRLTGDPAYREVLIESANSLISRFNKNVGCIRSWDWNKQAWQFPVIIDNMMNLELLFWATEETGDSLYYHIAREHAIKTLEHHFREDFGSFHVVDYDTVTGEVLLKQTHQGYADESTWSRGESWGIYGFTMVYRYTGEKIFLQQAENIASFILDHPNLPEDKVSYWDFDAPGIPNEPRDVSATAILTSALYELSSYSEQGSRYKQIADQILSTLSSSEYFSAPGSNKGFLLDHSVGHKPLNGGVDVPVIYADYYYLESLYRSGK